MVEFVVVIIVALVLGLVFLDRVLVYQELAEKTAAETSALNMRTGLRFGVLEMLVHNQDKEIAALIGSNPIKWVQHPLRNYAGEFHQAEIERVEPGNWYFDLDKGQICYRIMRRRHFVPGPSGQPELRYRVSASLRQASADSSSMVAEGVNLILIEPYSWFYAE
jgi:general secretion pathway protein G